MRLKDAKVQALLARLAAAEAGAAAAGTGSAPAPMPMAQLAA